MARKFREPNFLKKCDKEDPQNYRGIAISSCLSKIFTKI